MITILSHILQELLVQGLTWSKAFVLSMTGGFIANCYIFLFYQNTNQAFSQVPAATPAPVAEAAAAPSFWHNPAVIASILGVGVPIIIKLLDVGIEKYKLRTNTTQSRDANQMTFSEKAAEINHKERKEMIQELKEFHDTRVDFYKEQIIESKTVSFEARQRAHRYGNETQRVQAQLFLINQQLKVNDIDVPAFSFKSYDQLMEGLDDEVSNYRMKLELVEAKPNIHQTASGGREQED